MQTDLELLEIAQTAADKAWLLFCRIYPQVGKMPKIIFNNRLKTTAGRCDYAARVVDLSPSLMRENVKEFCNTIIPHELAHQVAFDVYGDTGHGPDWKSVMVVYGIEPARCHSLTSSTAIASAEKRGINKIRKIANQMIVGDRVTFVHRNRQRAETDIVGMVTKVNLKTYKIRADNTGVEWTVPKENTCNLRHA